MTFYIHPPGGDLHLRDLSSWCLQRMNFLLEIHRCHGNTMLIRDIVDSLTSECECLMEGSKRDATSHFTLRLMCCRDPEMSAFLVQSEIFFFKYRFSCFSRDEILSSLRPLRKHHNALRLSRKPLSEPQREILIFLDAITVQYSWGKLVKLYAQGSEGHFIHVPFRFVCDMVAERRVVVREGLALVPCCKLSDLMTLVFCLLLQDGMRLACCSTVVSDVRMSRVRCAIRMKYFSTRCVKHSTHQTINCEDILRLVESFPLCMSTKLRSLQETHRLRHHSRIQLTLFLKELGLPLNEAIHFWRQEYSQPSSVSEHSWQKDEKRYVYSIRHLYGMEGARRNYRSHCCEALQNSSDEGGCPFKYADLDPTLLSPETKEEISKLTSDADFSSASCKIHFLHKRSQNSEHHGEEVVIHPRRKKAISDSSNFNFMKPIEYFQCMNSLK